MAIATTGRACLARLTLPFSEAAPRNARVLVPRQKSLALCRRLIVQCFAAAAAAEGSDASRAPARLVQMRRLLEESEAQSAVTNEEVPKVSLEHVKISFARSGGPGGQNVNKVNTKVDMRFNVKNAHWLPERIRDKLMLMVGFLTNLLLA